MRSNVIRPSALFRLFNFGIGVAIFLYVFELRADVYDNGPPDHVNGLDMGNRIQADDFEVTEGSRFDGVKFWDFEGAGSFAGSVTWQLYKNTDSNMPGDLIASGVSIDLSHTETGFVSFIFREAVNEFVVPPMYLRPGAYWLGLHNGSLDNTSELKVFWANTANHGTPNNGTRPSYWQFAPYVGAWNSNYYIMYPDFLSEFAFQIKGVPAPKITNCTMTGGSPRIRFTTALGETYRVVYKNDLREAAWLALAGSESIAGTGNVLEVTDPDPSAKDLRQRYYRVEML